MAHQPALLQPAPLHPQQPACLALRLLVRLLLPASPLVPHRRHHLLLRPQPARPQLEVSVLVGPAAQRQQPAAQPQVDSALAARPQQPHPLLAPLHQASPLLRRRQLPPRQPQQHPRQLPASVLPARQQPLPHQRQLLPQPPLQPLASGLPRHQQLGPRPRHPQQAAPPAHPRRPLLRRQRPPLCLHCRLPARSRASRWTTSSTSGTPSWRGARAHS